MISPYSKPVLTVSQAIQACNSFFSELEFSIEGEVCQYNLSRGKYVFFNLKDETEEAQLSCFMMAYQQTVPLEDGMRIIVHGRPGIYSKSGQFRLTVNRLEPKGEGSLKRAFELLKGKLQEEGLFRPERKRLLPRFVQCVGIISSAEAAGFGDFQKIAYERLPGVRYVLANVAVQGKDAETQICQAFDYLNSHQECDVIVLIRGGGSLEDLQAFNSEGVARAIVKSRAPVLVGVGHERDVTIADFCADVRAATPSNAAQLLLPAISEVRESVRALTQQGRRQVESTIKVQRQRILQGMETAQQNLLNHFRHKSVLVKNLIASIDALSPQQTLRRGYTLTWDENKRLVTKAEHTVSGQKLVTQFSDGSVQSVIN